MNNIDLCHTVQCSLEENLGCGINPNLRRSLHGLDLAHKRHGRDGGPLSPALARNPLRPGGGKVRPPWVRHTPTHPGEA